MTMKFSELPRALERGEELQQRLAGKKLAVFLDYDGTLTPIVDRPEMAILSDSMRAVVSSLAARCSVATVSGRDRPDDPAWPPNWKSWMTKATFSRPRVPAK